MSAANFINLIFFLLFCFGISMLLYCLSAYAWAAAKGEKEYIFLKFNYAVGSFFYRIRHNRRLRKRQYHRSVQRARVPAGPERTSRMSTSEKDFFYLHEISMVAKVDLNEVEGQIVVSKQEYKRLQEYFNMTSVTSGDPIAAFAHMGLTLRVEKAASRTRGSSR